MSAVASTSGVASAAKPCPPAHRTFITKPVQKPDERSICLVNPRVNAPKTAHPDNGSTAASLPLASSGPGRFAAAFATTTPGVYTVRVAANGITLDGQTFHREQRLTAVIFIGGDQPPPQPTRSDPLCESLDCLRSSLGNGELYRELAARGLDLKELLACLGRRCHQPDPVLGGEQPYVPGTAAAADLAQPVSRQDLLDALVLSQQQTGMAGEVAFPELVTPEPRAEPKFEPMIRDFGLDLAEGAPAKRPPRRRGR